MTYCYLLLLYATERVRTRPGGYAFTRPDPDRLGINPGLIPVICSRVSNRDAAPEL